MPGEVASKSKSPNPKRQGDSPSGKGTDKGTDSQLGPPKKSAKKAAPEPEVAQSPPPKKQANATKIAFDSAVKDKDGQPTKTTKTMIEGFATPPPNKTKAAELESGKSTGKSESKPKRQERKEEEWIEKEDERIYVLPPVRPDVHKYTLIYCHYLCGHPTDYFEVKGFETPGLRVVLPKAPVYRSLHYGEGAKSSRTRIWYDYYYDPKDPNEDPKEGADAEELDEESEDEGEGEEEGGDEDAEEEEEEEDAADAGDAEDGGEEKGNRLQGFQDWLDGEKKKKGGNKFQEFLKTIKADTHPEIEIPKEAQVTKTVNRIIALIHKEAAVLGGDYSRIYLGGWSQGATVALLTAIHKDCPSLGGLLSITGTLHVPRVEAALQQPVKTTPFRLYAGVKDDTYPLMKLKPMIEKLRAVGYNIELREKDMGHNLNGRVGGKASDIEERWMGHYIDDIFQESTIGSLLKTPSAPVTLDEKDYEAAVKVAYGLLFDKKTPHRRKAEIMKHSITEDPVAEIHRRVGGLSAEELALVAKLLGAASCSRWELGCFLATPTATGIARIRAAVA
jgi:predicted esterase